MAGINSFDLQVTHHRVKLHHLPQEMDGFKIAQLTDIHRNVGISEEFIAEAVELSNRQHPDMVVLTGDFITRDPRKIESCVEEMKKLKAPRGVFAVLGNHDHWVDAERVTKAFESAGIPVLTNRKHRIVTGFYLVGIDDIWAGKPDPKKAFKGVEPNDAVVVIAHNPRTLDLLANHDCLILAGHTHGGQVRLPFLPAIKVPDLRQTPYVAGWYHQGKADMYINRGIGMVNPRIRIRCSPEISVFTLKSE